MKSTTLIDIEGNEIVTGSVITMVSFTFIPSGTIDTETFSVMVMVSHTVGSIISLIPSDMTIVSSTKMSFKPRAVMLIDSTIVKLSTTLIRNPGVNNETLSFIVSVSKTFMFIPVVDSLTPSNMVTVSSTFISIEPPVGMVTKSETVSLDRKSTRLNSSHANISYAVFCLKKK